MGNRRWCDHGRDRGSPRENPRHVAPDAGDPRFPVRCGLFRDAGGRRQRAPIRRVVPSPIRCPGGGDRSPARRVCGDHGAGEPPAVAASGRRDHSPDHPERRVGYRLAGGGQNGGTAGPARPRSGRRRRQACRRRRLTQPSSEFLDLQAALAGEYSLQRELGRGGMGVVYLARDVQLDRDVAIKVLPAHLAREPAARERFLREARMAAGLSHPHIVPIHRVSEAAGFVFFVMSYVEGESLGERLRTRGPLPPAEAMRVLREVAWALAYAHGRGIVHRDVKPDNILLEARTGRALVTDFGIAHGGRDPGVVTDPGKMMGTAQFMSPEQAAMQSIDGRSDIYALGVVGFLAVSGRLPFEAATLPAL